MRSIVLFIASAALAFVQAAAAQDVPTRVGRLAYTQGPVSVYQDPELGWDKAYVNTPVTSENSVWTDRGARAEVRVGGTALRLDGETQLDIARLAEDELDATVQRGSVNVRVRYKQGNDRITLSTPHALFMLESDGRYRLDVDEERDQSRLTVYTGRASMDGSSGRVPVQAGRTAIVSGSGEVLFERPRENAFDQWAAVRDQQWQDSSSRRYVSSDMTGYEELDRYGSWNQDADYGAIWYPTRIASGWAPYREGHWTYLRPWGWTWVDDAPWGYAPSHYGRWVQVRDRWGWVPGGVRESPVWAPALVGFIGGSNFSVGITSGSPVGWYPLAPWERYDPWYRAQPAYLTRVNRVVVDRQPRWSQGRGDEWRHWNRDRAATVVNRDVFVNRRPVQGSVVRMNPESIRQSSVVPGAQVVQQVLPQRNELVRYRQQNSVNVAAPTVMRQRPERAEQGSRFQQQQQQQQAQLQQQAQPQQQAQQQPGQVVRPDFRRRGAPPVAVVPMPAGQPQVAAPQPVQPQVQPQNPAARPERAQQRQADEAARAQAQQEQQRANDAQRQQQEQAQRQARDAQQQQQQQLQQRANDAQRQQQEQAQRQARDAQQQQQQQLQQRANDAQRQQQEQAQRQARDAQQQQQEQAQRQARDAQQQQQQEQAQRQARDAQQQQERAAREAQQQQQRAQQQLRLQQEQAQRVSQEQAQRAQQQQRQQQEAAQRGAQEQAQRAQQQQQQAQERAQREARQPQQPPQAQPQAQPQPQPQPQQQANPAARGDRGRARDDNKDDKEKDKEKDKR